MSSLETSEKPLKMKKNVDYNHLCKDEIKRFIAPFYDI